MSGVGLGSWAVGGVGAEAGTPERGKGGGGALKEGGVGSVQWDTGVELGGGGGERRRDWRVVWVGVFGRVGEGERRRRNGGRADERGIGVGE